MTKQTVIGRPFHPVAGVMVISFALAIVFLFYLVFANPLYSGGYAREVEEAISQEYGPLKSLARDLAEHNDSVHESLKTELSGFRGLNWYMTHHPERFNAPSAWFESVAKTEGIPAFKISELIQSAERGPVSTDEAAKWVLAVSTVLEVEKAARSQESGLQALREKNQALPNVSEGEADDR
mgnify:CR=1 FL=1